MQAVVHNPAIVRSHEPLHPQSAGRGDHLGRGMDAPVAVFGITGCGGPPVKPAHAPKLREQVFALAAESFHAASEPTLLAEHARREGRLAWHERNERENIVKANEFVPCSWRSGRYRLGSDASSGLGCPRSNRRPGNVGRRRIPGSFLVDRTRGAHDGPAGSSQDAGSVRCSLAGTGLRTNLPRSGAGADDHFGCGRRIDRVIALGGAPAMNLLRRLRRRTASPLSISTTEVA